MVGTDVVIVSACRSAVGSFGGTLKPLNAATLGGIVFKEAIKRAGIDPATIDDVRCGCVFDDKIYNNIGRVVGLMAGVPESVPAMSINRVCVSAMEAVTSGAALIKAGMVHFRMIGNDILDLRGINDRLDPGQHFIFEGRFDCVNEGNFLGHNQIGIIGAAARGRVTVKITNRPVNRPHPVNMIADLYR